MRLFSSSNDNSNEFKRGDRVRVKYAGIEGIIVSIENNYCMISYQNEQDKEVVETYNKNDIEKC